MNNDDNKKNIRGRSADEIVSILEQIAVDLTPTDLYKPGSIKVYRFDREGNELGTQVISKGALAKAFSQSMVVGSKNGLFKVLV